MYKIYNGDYEELASDLNREFFNIYEDEEICSIEEDETQKYDLIFKMSDGEDFYGIVEEKNPIRLYIIFEENNFYDKFDGPGQHIEYAVFDITYKPTLRSFSTACLLKDQKLDFEK